MTRFFGGVEITTLEDFENCPTIETLHNYSQDRLSFEKSTKTSLHIKKCHKCKEIVDEFKCLPFSLINGGRNNNNPPSSMCL